MSNHDHNPESRRRFLKIAAGTAAAAAIAGVLPQVARSAGLPHLSPADPAAVALGYVENTAKANQAKYPSHKVSQDCSNCNFYKGAAGSAWGPCQLFPGKDVAAKGWCSAHAPKA